MENVGVQNILKELTEMDKDMYMAFAIPEELNNKFIYQDIKTSALENLFTLALSTASDIANQFVFEDFLNEYVKAKEEFQDIMYETLQTIMEPEVYNYVVSGTCYWKINPSSSAVIVKKTPF